MVEIVSRIVHEAKAERKSVEEMRNIIENNVYGIEKDRLLYDEAIEKLNQLLSAYDIPIPSWKNLVCGDTLLLYDDFADKMDFCVGNPPYVRIHNINTEYRDVVKNFTFSSGTTDLYVIFYKRPPQKAHGFNREMNAAKRLLRMQSRILKKTVRLRVLKTLFRKSGFYVFLAY